MTSLYSALLGLFSNIVQSVFNARSVHETNKHNERLVDKQNAASALESEKAYRRSLPSQQIANMRAAGISDFAAAQSISGGGTYSPAPVNTAKAEAPQIDLSSAIESVTNAVRMKQEERMQNKLLKHQAQENAANRENQKEIAQISADSSKYTADTAAKTAFERLQHDKDDLEFRKRQYEETGKRLVESQINLNDKQREKIKAELDDFSSQPARDAREAEYQMRRIAALFGYHMNEREMEQYMRRHYTRDENGELVPRQIEESAENIRSVADSFWETIFSIIPVRYVLEALGIGLNFI